MRGAAWTHLSGTDVDEDDEDEGSAEPAVCDECGSRIRSQIQQDRDHCISCEEGSA